MPERGESNPSADTYVASAAAETKCARSHAHFTDLGALDPNHVLKTSVPIALNDQGTVVGFSVVPLSPSGSTLHAFRWKAETGMVDLGVDAGLATVPTGVNEREEVVGNMTMPGGVSQAVLWDAANHLHELGTLGGWESYARSINNRGQVVGDSREADGTIRSFIWEANTGMVALELPDSESATLTDINDSGVVVGSIYGSNNDYVPFKWTKDEGPTELDRLGGSRGEALSVNNEGEIAGYVIIGDERVGVKWSACGAQRIPPGPDGVNTMPRAINDHGTMVGDNSIIVIDTPPYGAPYTATEWDPMLRVTALPLDAPCTSAPDVNNCGDVTGVRLVDGDARGYLWQPERPTPQ